MNAAALLRAVLELGALLALLAICTAVLTGVHRVSGRQRRLADYRLRGQLREVLLIATADEPGSSSRIPRLMRRAASRRHRRRVLIEAACSISGAADADRTRRLADVADRLGLTRRLQRELIGGTMLTRAAAAETIGQLRLVEARGHLYVAMRDQRMAVRVAAAQAFCLTFPNSCATALVRMLQAEPTSNGQQRLAEIIAGMRGIAAEPLLTATAERPTPLLVRLVSICVPLHDALPVLVAAADTIDAATRLAAVRALGTMASSWAIPTLIEAVQDSDAFVRSAAVSALAATSDPNVLPYVLPALGDTDHVVRARASSAAAALAGGVAVAVSLTEEAENPQVQAAAAAAVQTHLVQGGILALASEDPGQRLAAERSVLALLVSVGYRRLAEQLATRHPHPVVRSAVTQLLERAPAQDPPAGPPAPLVPQRRSTDRVVLEGSRGPVAALPRQRRKVRAARGELR